MGCKHLKLNLSDRRRGTLQHLVNMIVNHLVAYRDADKSLARPGRKQGTATKDFEFHTSHL